jgi:uncharacterized protein (TIGR00251 family)
MTTTPDPLPAVTIAVRVIPRAGRSGVAGRRGDALLVRLNAPPVDGAANTELIEVLASALGIAKRSVTIVSGVRSRTKRVRLDGVTLEQLANLARAD